MCYLYENKRNTNPCRGIFIIYYKRYCNTCRHYYEGFGKFYCGHKCQQQSKKYILLDGSWYPKIPVICNCKDLFCNEICWNGNYIRGHHPKESDDKLIKINTERMKGNKFRKGIPISFITSKKMSEIRKGKHPTEKTLKKMSENNCMKRPEIIAKISGENHPNWLGGKSFGIYCPKFNNKKKEEIRNKYNRCCIICDKPETTNITKNGKQIKLSVHHIDYNKLQGCENHEWRLVPLCISCHMKTNRKKSRNTWEEKIKNIIYEKEKIL